MDFMTRYFSYDEPVFRPPAEAYSAIVQVTLGCSWNACAFCEMYRAKRFRVRSLDAIRHDVQILAWHRPDARKVFLADGNAMVLSANQLIQVLHEIERQFGRIQRVSSYALPRDILSKSEGELKALRKAGLKLLYVGIETGDDALLRYINKGETRQSTIDGLLKAHAAGIDTSVMIINGLGGKLYSEQHALHSAAVINQTAPRFLSTLTLGLPFGADVYQKRFEGSYVPLAPLELWDELALFLQPIQVPGTIFRSDHASNSLILKGTLCRDKEKLLADIAAAKRFVRSGS